MKVKITGYLWQYVEVDAEDEVTAEEMAVELFNPELCEFRDLEFDVLEEK